MSKSVHNEIPRRGKGSGSASAPRASINDLSHWNVLIIEALHVTS